MDNPGIVTLLPPVLVIVYALVTKRTFEALITAAQEILYENERKRGTLI